MIDLQYVMVADNGRGSWMNGSRSLPSLSTPSYLHIPCRLMLSLPNLPIIIIWDFTSFLETLGFLLSL